MSLTMNDTSSLYNLFKIESKNYKIEPKISSFEDFNTLYESNKKIKFTHLDCNNYFNLSLKELIQLNQLNHEDKKNPFKCIYCIKENHLNFKPWRLKDKFSKFLEFAQYFKTIPSIETIEDYRQILESNINILVTHIDCQESTVIPLNEWQFLNNKNKHLKQDNYSHLCTKCVKKKASENIGWEWNNKYKRFKSLSEGFDIYPLVKDIKDYKEQYENEVFITHKKCNSSFKIVLKKWMNLHTTNRSTIDNYKSHLCLSCSQKKKNEQFQKHLNEKYNNEFVLISDFNGTKNKVYLRHTNCNGTFDIVPENYRHNPITCGCCGKKSSSFEINEIKKLNKKLQLYLEEHNLTNFVPLRDSDGVSKPMLFKSKICGHTFERTARSLIPFGGKDYCPECIDLRYKSENQQDRNDYFQSKLDETHGEGAYTLVSDYNGQNTDVKVVHRACKNEIDVYSETIRKDYYRCPYCESTSSLKYSNYISLSKKIELYENESDNRYKILTPFIHLKERIKVKHLECGTVFEVTVNTFKKSKEYEICPECKKKARLNHALETLKQIHKNDYILLNPEDFESITKPLKFKHKCGATVEKTFSALKQQKGATCTHCSSNIDTTNKLKGYAFNKYKGEYLVLSEYTKVDQPVKFRHKKCGRIFKISSKDFQNRKTPCPHCSKESTALTTKEVQSRANNKFGNLFKVCGEYKNSKTEMTIMCNNCSHIFSDKLSTFLGKNKCPSCKTKYL